MGVIIQGATRKATLSWNTRALGRYCRKRGREGAVTEARAQLLPPLPCWALPPPRWATARNPGHHPTAATSAYRVGRVQQGDGEGNEAREVGVRECKALHVEVCAVLAARELQGVRGLLGPQDSPVPGGLFAPLERTGEAQVCILTS